MAEADQVSSDVSEDGIVKSRLSSYFPREYAAEEQHVIETQRVFETQRDVDPRHDVASQHDIESNPWEPSPMESNPVIDHTPVPAGDPALVLDGAAHGGNGHTHEETHNDMPDAEAAVVDEPAIEAAGQPKTATFAVRPVPPRFAPSEQHFEIPAEPQPDQIPEPRESKAPPAPATDALPPPARRRPIKEEALASIVAGRTFDNEEAERAFLLTLSRDQRLKYAELLHADEQLELDVERHNLQVDLLDFERERIEAADRTRRSENAFTFANQTIRALVMLNGLGAVVILGVWGYLAATPGAQFNSQVFEQALWALGLGALATVLTALSSYVTQALMAWDDDTGLRYWLIAGIRGLGISLALAGLFGFLAGLYLASYGLRAI